MTPRPPAFSAANARARWPAPFPGLLPFQEVDAELYFGRGETIDELLRRLERNRFLVVVGPSGSGKSSLIQAGLVPAIGAGFLSHAGARWWQVHMRVDESPLRELADAVWRARHTARGGGEAEEATRQADLQFLEATLRASDLGLVRALLDQGLPADAEVLVWVEHGDELVRRRSEASPSVAVTRGDAQTLVDLLLAAARQSQRRIHVVLTMRAESLDACEQFAGFPEAVNAGLFVLPRMTRQGMQDAIEGPLERFGATWEPEFVARILNDVEGQPDPLPRFQHALLRSWYHALDRVSDAPPHLRLDDYRAVGGFQNVIQRQAQELVDDLQLQAGNDGARRRIPHLVRRLRERLGRLDPLGADASRSVTVEQIQAAAEAPWNETCAVVGRFARSDCSFLLLDALDADSILPETRVALAHESLLRYWPAPPGEEPVMAMQPASLAAAAGSTSPRPEARLETRWNPERPPRGRWRPFLVAWAFAVVATASVGMIQWVMSEARERRLSAEPPQRSAAQPPAATAMATASPTAVPPTREDKLRAERLARSERSSGLSAALREQDPVQAVLLAAEAAIRLQADDPRPPTLEQTFRDALARCSGRALAGHGEPVRAVAISPDERWAVTVADAIRIWDLRAEDLARSARTLPLPGPGDGTAPGSELQDHRRSVPVFAAIRFTPESSHLEATLAAGEVWRWNLSEPATPPGTQTLPNVVPPLGSVAFRPGTELFATCDNAGAVDLWTPGTDAEPPLGVRLSSGGNRVVAFSGDGRYLVTAGGLTQVWEIDADLLDLRGTLLAAVHQEFLRVAVSRTGRWVAAADAAHNVFLWDWRQKATAMESVTVDAMPARAEGRGGAVTDLVFDPQERWLACGAEDRSAHVWDLPASATSTPTASTWALGHDGAVRGLTTSVDGRWLFSRADDGAIAAWSLPPRNATERPVALWRNVAGAHHRLVRSDLGNVLATVDGDGQARVWDLAAAADIGGQFLLPHGFEPLGEWIWSPKGERVATIVSNGSRTELFVWRTSGARGLVPEESLEIPAELLVEIPPQLRFGAGGESLAAIGAAAPGEPTDVALWRLPPLHEPRAGGSPFHDSATPRRPDFQLAERFQDLRIGARWLLLVTPSGKMRVWGHEETRNAYVELAVPSHSPALEVRLSPDARRLAVVHPPQNRAGDAAATFVVALWGPPPGGDAWSQLGYWELLAPPSSAPGPWSCDVVISDRWLVVRCSDDTGKVETLRGWRLDAAPPRSWSLPLAGIEDFRVSLDDSRLMVDREGESRVYALEETPQLLHTVNRGNSERGRPIWSADGRWLATENAAEAIVLRDLSQRSGTRRIRLSSAGEGTNLFFDRRGETLYALDRAGFAHFWPTSVDGLPLLARRAAGRNLAPAEWETAFADERPSYRETFPGLGPGQLVAPRSESDSPRAVVAARPEEDGTIRFFLESLPTLPDGQDAGSLVREAWRAWTAVGPVAATEVDRTGRPHVVIRTERLDGPEGVPGHGQLGPPQEGLTLELRFDSEANWTADLLRLVSVHELGHVLGLTHTQTPGQLMSDTVPDSARAPQAEDIQRLKELWEPRGRRAERPMRE